MAIFRLGGVLTVVLLMNGGFAFLLNAAENTDPPALVWCGLDYSKVKMLGTRDFRRPGEIFPEMLAKWNSLFMKEMLPELEKMERSLRTDLTSTQQRNEKASADQIEAKDGTEAEMVKASHITEPEIAQLVQSAKLESKEGLGLIFVMDRLVKNQEVGCMYVVFFEISSRQIIHSERAIGRAGGGGFRNYWFRPIKEVVDKLPKMYRTARSKRANA